ncbi:ureidoglycolate lyase [Bordetella sp. H567]|uniref:ureidoglycolate lyase n=1 Tax=Bordetella sp. H567 TaxID=1697043 RepID=UPI00082EC275|nr:ureidoglycolate lyase [Bordetella sp. H567]
MPLQHIAVRPDGDARLAPYGLVFPVTPGDERIPIPLDAIGAEARGAFTATVIRARSSRAAGPLGILERHPYSVQAFVPLGAYRLVAVAAPRGQPPTRLGQLTAIHIPAGWGFAWHPGVWHTGMMGDGMDAALVSMVRRMPDGADTETTALPFSIDPAEPHTDVQ